MNTLKRIDYKALVKYHYYNPGHHRMSIRSGGFIPLNPYVIGKLVSRWNEYHTNYYSMRYDAYK